MISKCKYFTIRKQRGCPYFFCRYSGNKITLDDCKNCSNLILRTMKGISKRSTRQNVLEKSRNKIERLKDPFCYYCHRRFENLDKHEIYGGSNRKRSIENGFVVNLCRACHSNEEIIQKLRIEFQKKYEQDHTREEFIQLIGKSYIKED